MIAYVSGAQLLVGFVAAGLSVLCVLFHYEVMNWSSRLIPRLGVRRRARIVLLILALLAAHGCEVWFFGLTYWGLHHWSELGGLVGGGEGVLDFVYYSVVVYTTLGLGDIVPAGEFRILTGSEALVGLGLITWSASLAFLEMQRDWGEFRHPTH